MGAAASINKGELAILSAEELANKIALLGDEYAVYKESFITKEISGAKVSVMSKDEQIHTLNDIGVTNEAHQEALIAEFEKLKIAEPSIEPSHSTESPHISEPAVTTIVEESPVHIEESKAAEPEPVVKDEIASAAVTEVDPSVSVEAAHVQHEPQAIAAN